MDNIQNIFNTLYEFLHNMNSLKKLNFTSPLLSILLFLLFTSTAFGHGVSGEDAAFLESVTGFSFFPYLYLGAKHMFTGYDHLLFLAGVIFFLYRMKDVALYVSLFAIGHSLTLLIGILGEIRADAYIVDAIIGLSVVYKGFENIGGFKRLGININTRAAIFLFGLVHGFGLSTKLQDLSLSQESLVGNMLSFNIGVELGQLAALAFILLAFKFWRQHDCFIKGAVTANLVIMTAGFMLFGYQLTGYFVA